jgi:hypothetical protein
MAQQGEGTVAMTKYRLVPLHAGAAAALVFVLQRFVLGATTETSVMWAVIFGVMAGGLAIMQANR